MRVKLKFHVKVCTSVLDCQCIDGLTLILIVSCASGHSHQSLHERTRNKRSLKRASLFYRVGVCLIVEFRTSVTEFYMNHGLY